MNNVGLGELETLAISTYMCMGDWLSLIQYQFPDNGDM